MTSTFNELLELYKSNKISQRQFITNSKTKFAEDIINITSFIDTDDILERLYYIINDLHDIVRCKYCGNKAIWSGRIKDGYKDICNSKDCRSKQLANAHKDKTIVSANRDDLFVKQQADISLVTDNVIKDLVKYDKHVELIDNPRILSYLDLRYTDSSSRLETVQRIRFGIDEKPKCPTCGNSVQWIGKNSKLYTTYCSNKCSAQNKETTAKKKATQLEHWGTENCYDSEKYRQHLKETIGVEYHTQRKDIKDKRKESLIKHYGTTKLYKVEEIRNKIIESNRLKFGCDCAFQNKNVREAAYKAILNNEHGTSKAEDQIYNWLVEIYGEQDVQRFKTSEIFPFNVDFYLAPYDLYIEYQGSQFHNGRAFLGTKEDHEELQELDKKDKIQCEKTGKDKSQYRSIINTWSIFDVKKREYAKEHKINYLEIYQCNSIKDLEYQLSIWILLESGLDVYYPNNIQNEFDYYKSMNETELSNKPYIHNEIIKYFQHKNFFRHEIDLYVNDPVIRRKLIQNRCKYLNKKESELTIDELLTGFKKSGIYYGYSHFDPRWTNWFVNKYQLKTIYDPCGGWGHHLLGMLKCDKIIYNDYSKSTVESIQRLKEYFNIDNLDVHYGDATNYIPDEVDGWFMCPPYYNLEHYECGDFNDLETYKKFLNDIFNIWKNSKARIFGIIIREDLIEYINENYTEVYDIKVSKSHLINNKSNIEKFYIFKK